MSDPYHTASTSQPPRSKSSTSRYNVVNATSLFDLKAELEKGKDKFNKQAKDGETYVRGVQREGKVSRCAAGMHLIGFARSGRERREGVARMLSSDVPPLSMAALEVYRIHSGTSGRFSS